MFKLLPVAAGLLGFSPVNDPAMCASPCKDDDSVAVVEATYDYDVDADVFTLHTMAADLCATARDVMADGASEDEMIDSAVEVFVDEGVVTTPEGVYYLRGLLRGCVA